MFFVVELCHFKEFRHEFIDALSDGFFDALVNFHFVHFVLESLPVESRDHQELMPYPRQIAD